MSNNSDKELTFKDLLPVSDDEFSVSITKAAELTGLSESQIRYLENLPGISIGKRGLKERNRVYTKQDVILLKWISKQDNRPSEIAKRLQEHKEEILRNQGHITLNQVIQQEQFSYSQDVLISGLVTILLSIWQETVHIRDTRDEPIIRGVIFGPQNNDWKASFLQSCAEKRSVDLANSLVVWSTVPEEDILSNLSSYFGNLTTIFTQQTWYLSFSNEYIYDTSYFSNTTDPFAVVIIWNRSYNGKITDSQLQERLQQVNISSSRYKLVKMLVRSLQQIIEHSPQLINAPISIYSRGIMGRYTVMQGLSSFLDFCIRPYFADCYSYIAKFGQREQLEILAFCGDKAVGFLPTALETQETPWWIKFVRNRSSLALAQKSTISPFHSTERGSVVCFPLIKLNSLIGVFGIENIGVNNAKHCLTEREGFTDADLLQYLICVAEIAAEYLSRMDSFTQKIERTKVAYTNDTAISWWLDVYYSGGSNYTRFIQAACDWIEQAHIPMNAEVNLILVDIYNEGELAKKHQGFEVVIDILSETKNRINKLIEHDPITSDLSANKRLFFFNESVGEHLLLIFVDVPRNYLLIFLEQIRRFWHDQEWQKQESSDKFIWKGNEVEVLLQIGICRLVGLAGYERKIASGMMNYHLRKLAQKIYEREKDGPLNHVIEYEGEVLTEKAIE